MCQRHREGFLMGSRGVLRFLPAAGFLFWAPTCSADETHMNGSTLASRLLFATVGYTTLYWRRSLPRVLWPSLFDGVRQRGESLPRNKQAMRPSRRERAEKTVKPVGSTVNPDPGDCAAHRNFEQVSHLA
jgi:hypothetical protein